MLPHINLPTRLSNSSQTLIDNVIVSPHNFTSVSGNFISGISDHLPQFFIFRLSNNLKNSSEPTMYKDWKKSDSKNFRNDFNLSNWDVLLKN